MVIRGSSLNDAEKFSGRLALQQRVLPRYRAAFVDCLAEACTDGLFVFAGQPLRVEGIEPANSLEVAHLTQAQNLFFRDPSSKLFLCWQRDFVRWLEEIQPEALIVEANPRNLATRLAIRWMHRQGKPVVGWGLGAPPLTGSLTTLRRWERLSLVRSLDALVAYSHRGAEQYRALGLPAGRVFVASNAVAPRPSQPPVEKAIKVGAPLTVFFVGRLQERKRLDHLLSACAALPLEMQPRLLIAGDGPERDKLQALAKEIYPPAEFLGARHGAELEPYFRVADLFVLPGTGGLAVQQAMAHALPVIVARADGTQDDLVRPENGWQIPPDDLESLKEALKLALSDPARLHRMGQEAYRVVAEEVNIEAMVKVFIDALKIIISAK
jgi:glycosyltransferase involved in cell wall biosynthesis